jgi:hypothetical protein
LIEDAEALLASLSADDDVDLRISAARSEVSFPEEASADALAVETGTAEKKASLEDPVKVDRKRGLSAKVLIFFDSTSEG